MQSSQNKTVQKKYVNDENVVKNVEWTVQTNNVQKRVVNSAKATGAQNGCKLSQSSNITIKSCLAKQLLESTMH
jgi:hypothetical protein